MTVKDYGPQTSLSRRQFLGVSAGAGVALAGAGRLRRALTGTPRVETQSSPHVVSWANWFSAGLETQVAQSIMSGALAAVNVKVEANFLNSQTFQSNAVTYCQATPQDIFIWDPSYSLRYMVNLGLFQEMDAVWDAVGHQFSPGFKTIATGKGGHQYWLPFDTNPWVVYYRKSVWDKHGYHEPKTMDDFLSLAKTMKKDGLIPIAFGNQEGWECLNTFDYLDMRINGYSFHMSLCNGDESWTDKRVLNVLDAWVPILEYSQPGANGLTWQQAATPMISKKAGMMIMAGFVVESFPADQQSDLAIFPFPEINPAYGTEALEAPTDGWVIAARGTPKDPVGENLLLEYLARPEVQAEFCAKENPRVATNLHTGMAHYTPLQRQLAELQLTAKQISQFLTTDGNPAFGSNVVAPQFAKLIDSPSTTAVPGIAKAIEKQHSTYFK